MKGIKIKLGAGMRKLLAIVFLFLFTSSTEAGELLKLPLLANHYLQHKEEGRSENLLDFIKEHYIGHHGKDQDNKQDEELPFKAFHAEHFSFSFINNTIETNKTPALFVIKDAQTLPSQDLPLNLAYSIFHPPRGNC